MKKKVTVKDLEIFSRKSKNKTEINAEGNKKI
jgi:hypothetical protein